MSDKPVIFPPVFNPYESYLETAKQVFAGDTIAALMAQLAECRAVLKEVEWNGLKEEGNDYYCNHTQACPVCGADAFVLEKTGGPKRPFREVPPSHAPDCRLKKALGP